MSRSIDPYRLVDQPIQPVTSPAWIGPGHEKDISDRQTGLWTEPVKEKKNDSI